MAPRSEIDERLHVPAVAHLGLCNIIQQPNCEALMFQGKVLYW